MRKIFSFDFKSWEVGLIVLSVLFFLISCLIYMTNFPLRKYLFDLTEEDGKIVIGHLIKKDGILKRQIVSESEFRPLDNNNLLYNMDVLVTGPDSSATLQFDNGGSVDLAASTMIRLAFQSNLALDGINRLGKLDVVSGSVTGKAGKHRILISSSSGITEIKPNTTKKLEVSNAPVQPKFIAPKPFAQLDNFSIHAMPSEASAPIPTPSPTPTPSSSPSPSPIPSPVISPSPSPVPTPKEIDEHTDARVVTPSNGTIFKVEGRTLKPEKSVTFTWKVFPSKSKVLVTLWRISDESASSSAPEEVFKRVIAAHQGKGEFTWVLQRPGNYEWTIQTPAGQPFKNERQTHAKFRLNPEFFAINPLATLVAGQSAISNKLSSNLLTDFDITLRWESFPKVEEYKINFFDSKSAKQSILERMIKKPEFTFNKNKIFSGHIFYKVTTPVENGFIATTGIQEFSFTFLPPQQVTPADHVVLTSAQLKAEGLKTLFTWQKTNFTLGYEFEMSKDAEFAQIYLKKSLKENYFIMPSPPPGTYWWRVRSFSRELSSPMSHAFIFTVSP